LFLKKQGIILVSLWQFYKWFMKINNIDGEIVKDNKTYLLKDNTSLKNLVVSSTTLHPGKSTRGHSHPGKEEVYMIMSGTGRMQLDDNEFDISGGEMVLIEDGVFHRVHNTGDIDLYMVCIFDGDRNH
jgi:mannose-6-phosphate isomerase-like protein (cupin superfamily)